MFERFERSWDLGNACMGLLREDKSLLIFPLLSSIAMFLIAGLVTVLQHTRTTSVMQTQMAQLQDGERLAMSMMAGVVESAGYFPNPVLNSAVGTMPGGLANSAFLTAGTPVITGGTNAQGDTFTVRYAAAQFDNVFNCQGGSNIAVGPFDSWENTFSVNAQNQLVCTLWTASTAGNPPVTTPLVGGVQSMTVLYGVQTNGGGTQTCTDTYMTAAQVTAAPPGAPTGAWASVCSVVVTLTFFDPTYPAASGRTVPPFTRVIALMQTAGVT